LFVHDKIENSFIVEFSHRLDFILVVFISSDLVIGLYRTLFPRTRGWPRVKYENLSA